MKTLLKIRTKSVRIDCEPSNCRNSFQHSHFLPFFLSFGTASPAPLDHQNQSPPRESSMAFDADPLWWPPAARLQAMLTSSAAAAAASASKNGNVDDDDSSSSSAAAQRLSATLKEYERWLIAGLHTFKAIKRGGGAAAGGSSNGDSPSRAALLAGAPLSLSKGAKKIAVDGRLVQAAIELAVVAVSRDRRLKRSMRVTRGGRRFGEKEARKRQTIY